jgi:hypothetical protein
VNGRRHEFFTDSKTQLRNGHVEKIECCGDVITHGKGVWAESDRVAHAGGVSPVGQIQTRNRNVYFELRKFPLDRDKGDARWREPKKVYENEARVSEVRIIY